MNRIISTILVLATLIGCLAVLPFASFASVENGDTVIEIRPIAADKLAAPYLKQEYYSAQDKLDRDSENMQLYVRYGTKELYASALTGEVYVKDTLTGNILNSNPFDMSPITSETIRKKVMSQIILSYERVKDKVAETYNSYEWSASRGQITIDPIIDGIRVNYAIGDTTKRYLLPYGIMAKDMIELLFAPLQQLVEEDLRQAATASGVPEAYMTKYFDFTSYCEANKARFSTEKMLGVEYIYGNLDAFEGWLREIDRFYRLFYNWEDFAAQEQGNDPKVPRSDEEKATMYAPKNMNALADEYNQISGAYSLVTPYINYNGDDPEAWPKRDTTIEKFPVLGEKTEKHPTLGKDYLSNAIFVLSSDEASKILRNWEALFGKYVDGYTLSDAESAENETGVKPAGNDKPVFYVALEYLLTEEGFDVRIPATSIMYDESNYTVTSIQVLPYMGSGDVNENGYIFYPDGSGAVIEYEDYRKDASVLSGQIYGHDFSYYTITGQHQKNIFLPVFGTVHDNNVYELRTPFKNEKGEYIWTPCTFQQYSSRTYTITYEETKEGIFAVLPYGIRIPLEKNPKAKPTDKDSYKGWTLEADGYYKEKNITSDNVADTVTELRAKDFRLTEENTGTTGFFAIVEGGAALSKIHASMEPMAQNPMSAAYSSFAPRCEDSYNLSDSVSSITDANASFDVLAEDKYMGSYTTRFVMLTDDASAKRGAFAAGLAGYEKLPKYYGTSYAGMAECYRAYLLGEGLLPESTESSEDLPLFIESFGVIQTLEKYLSIPFTVDVALTAFDDVKKMYEELGIDNVKFRLTGFANGGMFPTYPVQVDWESEAGGDSGFEDLLAYAQEKSKAGLEIFPNFDFLYIVNTGWFDGIDMKDIGARSADNRYAMRKTYSSVYQTYTFSATDGILVAANMLDELFSEFDEDYSDYNVKNLSMAGIASDLSSDFNDENTLTREEAKDYITDLLAKAGEKYALMSTGGNAYALQYMKYLLEAPVDSSHFRGASRTVPFWGMVVHSHIQYAGGAFNEESNKNEALLRAIESGAALYFLLSYDNTRLMKNDSYLSDYYSVNYQISRGTVEEYYKILNEAIGDLQDYHIVDHRIVLAERVGLKTNRDAQKKELQDEFMVALLNEVEEQKANIRRLIDDIRALKIDVDNIISKYDTNGDGVLTGDEQNTAWSDRDLVKTGIKAVARKYQSLPMIKELIDHVNLDIDDNQERDNAEDAAARKIYMAVVNDEIPLEYGETTVGVAFDDAAVLESARRHMGVDALEADFIAEIRSFMKMHTIVVNSKHMVAEIGDFDYTPKHNYFTTSDGLDSDYMTTESTVSDGTVVMVTYSNGKDNVSFILNFNIFAVNVRMDGQLFKTLGKYEFVKIEEGKEA